MDMRKVVPLKLGFLTLVVSIWCLTVSVLAQTSTFNPKADNPTGHSTVTGRAVYEDTGRPVRRAPVILLSTGGQAGTRSSVTNADGEFSFKNVSSGDYRVVV